MNTLPLVTEALDYGGVEHLVETVSVEHAVTYDSCGRAQYRVVIRITAVCRDEGYESGLL
jgi:hypothetical protein